MVQISLKGLEIRLISMAISDVKDLEQFSLEFLAIIQKFRKKTTGKLKKSLISKEVAFANKHSLKAFIPAKYRGVKK